MVPAPSVKVPRVSTYSGSRCVCLSFMYGAFTLSGWLSQNHSITLTESRPRSEPQHARTLVWALSLSLAATQEIEFSFSSSGYLDVSVHRVPFHTLWIGVWIPEGFSGGFPHSDISGSLDICSSPKLFAAYHVFHRLLVPRHPPCALFCLASSDVIALTSDGLLVFLSLAAFAAPRFRLYLTFNVSSRNECFTYAVFKVQSTAVPAVSGDKEIRTLDPLLARQVLSQLSYIPIFCFLFSGIFCLMGLSGLEPPTSRLSGVRSNQLSYKPFLDPAATCFPMPSPA